MQASKQHATAPQYENKRHGRDVKMKLNKTCTPSYLQKQLEHAQKVMARLQIITVSQTWQKSLDMAEITLGCNVYSYQTTCYRYLSWQKKGWHANTKDKEQNSLTELIPKINRKHGSIHATMASNMTDSDLVKITVHGRNNDK